MSDSMTAFRDSGSVSWNASLVMMSRRVELKDLKVSPPSSFRALVCSALIPCANVLLQLTNSQPMELHRARTVASGYVLEAWHASATRN
eukprot:4432052-Amphidinium_carterae.2